MLQIPVLPFKTKENMTKPHQPDLVSPERESALRGELTKTFAACPSPAQAYLQLAAWAGPHAATLAANPGLRCDYKLFIQYARQAALNESFSQQERMLCDEEEMIISAGAKAVSAETLAEYLQAQSVLFEKKLAKFSSSKQEIETRLMSLRRRTVIAACTDALAAEDTARGCDLLAHFEEELPPELARRFEIKITWQFARGQAHSLWERAQRLFPQQAEQAAAWAREQNKEKNEVLRARIDTVLNAYKQAALHEENVRRADLLKALAESPAAAAADLLAKQSVLEAGLLEKYALLCTRLDQPAKKADPALFIKLYFSGGENEISQAYAHGYLSVREFFRLCSQALFRACGEVNLPARIRCQELKTLLAKKDFPPSEIVRFQYELLTAADNQAAWEELKNLINK